MYETEVKKLVKEKFGKFGFEEHQYPNAIGMWKNEQESLVWAALNAPEGNWLEIGSFCGGSAVLLCLARRFLGLGGSVYSVDRNFSGWRGAFDRNLYTVGKFQDISKKIECDSANLKANYNGDPISFALIDGWHSFRGVINDFLQIEEFLVPGAIVCFHDTAPQPYKTGQLAEYYESAKKYYDQWMSEETQVDRQYDNVAEYHQSEQEQDFLIDEALAWIMYEKNFEYIKIPVIDGSTHFDRVPQYKHGTTSPYHGLVALRKV